MADKKYLRGVDLVPMDGSEKLRLNFGDPDTEQSISDISRQLDGLEQSKTTQRAFVIPVDGWKGEEAPYTYDFGAEYEGKNINVGFNRTDGTDGQLEAARSAGLAGGTGTIIYATNLKPVVDIPVILQIS